MPKMPNRQTKIFTAKRLSKNAKFDLLGITKCQLARLQIMITVMDWLFSFATLALVYSSGKVQYVVINCFYIRNFWIST